MRKFTKRAGVAAVCLSSLAVAMLGMSGAASADTGAQPGDIVAVGSDTIQNAADFLFDGYPGKATGFNDLGNLNRVDNVFATGDANGRAVYDGTCGSQTESGTGLGYQCDSSQDESNNATAISNGTDTPNLLPGSVVLRAGTKPVTRPNGSGAGVAALTADSSSTGYDGLADGSIQIARMSRLPDSTEEANCSAITACGSLHVFQAATDHLAIAVDSSAYNGPSGLSAKELYNIFVTCDYRTWSQLPGYTGSEGSETIDPLIPQSGSGTRNFFLADLATAEGISGTLTPGSCTRTVEEHDPTGIYSDPNPAAAIEPFSLGKIAVLNSGYFEHGAGYTGPTAEPYGAYTPNFLTTLTGTPTDGNPIYDSIRGLYFTVRQTDLTDSAAFEPGGNFNWVTTLFMAPWNPVAGTTSGTEGSTSVIGKASNAALITDAGFTQAYKDCGTNPTSC